MGAKETNRHGLISPKIFKIESHRVKSPSLTGHAGADNCVFSAVQKLE